MRQVTLGKLDHLMTLGDALLNHSNPSVSPHDASGLILTFLREANYTPLATPLNSLDTWYRARFQAPDEVFKDHLSELLYRIRPPTDPGRVHQPGERIFYAGWNASTAFSEIDVQKNGNVWLSHVRPKASAQVLAVMIGSYEHYFRAGRLHYPSKAVSDHMAKFFSQSTSEEALHATLYADTVLAKLLRTPDNSKYHLTSAIARLLHSGDQLTTFLYPSVQAASAINIAVKDDTFDAAFEVLAVHRFEVQRNLGWGNLVTSSKQICHDFSIAGHINWFSQRRHITEFSMETGLRYSSEASAWSVPPTWKELKAAAAA